MHLLAEKRVIIFFVSLFLLIVSMAGPPAVQIKEILLTANLAQLISLYNENKEFFRLPDTNLRFLLFNISMGLLILSTSFRLKKVRHSSKFFDTAIRISLFTIFLFILITDKIYNIAYIVLFLLSTVYFIIYRKNNLSRSEIFLLFSYFLFFYTAFVSAFLIKAPISEVDNYTRFLIAIPIYLALREIKINLGQFFCILNITSILIGIFALYCFIILEQFRVMGFTSSATIFGNISLIFSLVSFITINHYVKSKKSIILPIAGFLLSFLGWNLTGARGSVLAIILFIFLFFIKKFRENFILTKKISILLIIVAISILIFQNNFIDCKRKFLSCPNVFQRIINETYDSDQLTSRLIIWRGAINMIHEKPLTGIGLTNFNKSLSEQIYSGKISKIRRDFKNPTAGQNHAHNQYLDMYAKNGLFGLLTLLYFLFIHLKLFLKSFNSTSYDNRLLSMLGVTVVVSYFSFMINHTILSHQLSTIFMLLILITLLAILNCKIYAKEELK